MKKVTIKEIKIWMKTLEDAHTAVARGCLSEAQLITEEKDETNKK